MNTPTLHTELAAMAGAARPGAYLGSWQLCLVPSASGFITVARGNESGIGNKRHPRRLRGRLT